MLRGSPLYLAPEAASGGEVTPLSDQYSLGVLLYECAVGAHPFMADAAAESIRRITHGEYPALSQHEARPSAALVHLIERAMSLDPEERFPDLKALGRELLLLAGERTRMTWSLSFGEAGPVLLTRRKLAAPTAPLRRLSEVFDRERLRRFDWSTAAAILFGLVTFTWGIAILLAR
jgi:serine/threonine protein kinase